MSHTTPPYPSAPDGHEPPEGNRRPQSVERAMGDYAKRAGLRRDDHGQLDVLHAVGGWRGLLEAILPGLIFLVVFLLTQQLAIALIASLATALLFAVARLAQRQSLMQSIAGLIGVAVCALFARVGGQALDYYVPGFFVNIAWLIGLSISAAVGWPLLGVFYGYVRGEGMDWRKDRQRRGAYQRATLLLIGMFAARLLVQVPLFFAENVAALGVARLVMGVPLYALVLWLGWLLTRPIPSRG
ncbi:DUF3159 domain-containing protein [Kocuria sp. cx-455]|uniref:DUF3159 domain-containing protein n=1 Tax=Kocuria sp. cx-455 TaxID=2771377 RepID=UPI002805CFEA|nr:DUF3159 domain-containing protein [Kocuria sp. cx-455]